MKRIVKTIGIIILAICLILTIFIVEESLRIENHPGVKPLIITEIDAYVSADTSPDRYSETYKSIGFSVKYDYLKDKRDDDSDLIRYYTIKGEFKLFNKYTIWQWIS